MSNQKAPLFTLHRNQSHEGPGFASMHGTNNSGLYGERIGHGVFGNVLGEAYMQALTAGPGSYGYDELSEHFSMPRIYGQAYMRQLDKKRKSGIITAATAIHHPVAMAYVKPEGESRARTTARRASEAATAHIVDFAVRPGRTGFGIGSLLLHESLAIYPEEATAQFDVLGPYESPVESWLIDLGFEYEERLDNRQIGPASVQARLFVAPSVGAVREALSHTGYFKAVESAAA